MKSEFLMALNQLSAERDLPIQVILDAVEAALVSAYRRDAKTEHNVIARVDPENGQVHIFAQMTVVEEVEDDRTEIPLEVARKIQPDAEVGQEILIDKTPENFGRIAAQTAKQVIMQRIREAERERVYNEYAEKEGEIIIGAVRSVGDFGVVLSLGKAEAHLPRGEQIPRERYRQGDRVKAYVSAVEKGTKGVKITVSRTHPNMLRRLLELEVPEIFNGTVEIKAIAREAGARSKVAVTALQPGIDPVGSCVGMRGVRIQNIVSELSGEKIDIVEWSPDPATFIANALSPAKVLNVILDDSGSTPTAIVIVPEDQLSLAIGREGQNARLAARLTGWRIDIKGAAEMAEEILRQQPEAAEEVEKPQDLLSLAEALLLKKGKAEPPEEPEEEEAAPVEAKAGPEEAVTEAEEVPEEEEEEKSIIEEALPAEPEEAEAEAVEAAEAEAPAAETGEPEPEEEVEEAAEEPPSEAEEAETPEEPEQEEEEEEMAEAFSLEADLVEEFEFEEEEEEEDEDYRDRKRRKKDKKSRRKKRRLVYDEETGEVIIRRVRKPGRRKEDWEDYVP